MAIVGPVLAAIGVALLSVAVATSIPLLAAAGAVCLVTAWALRTADPASRWRGLQLTAAMLLTAVGAMGAAVVGFLWANARPPAPDAFYEAPASAASQPGALLRAEPFTRAVPGSARAWRILYATTRSENAPAVASAVVLAPSGLPDGPRPVIAWTHGTTGIAPGCAPSVLPSPFPFDPMLPALDQLLDEKWVLVATDYVGLGTGGPHPYLIGEGEARSALDALRAAKQLPDLTLENRAVVWGYSQGGHAAMWTGIVAPRYAPDVGVIGVAALAPATDLAALIDAAQHTTIGKVMSSLVAAAYSATYPEVSFDLYVGPRARARAMASRCLSGPGVLLSVLTSLTMGTSFFAIPPTSGPLAERLRENTPSHPIEAPLLIAQGLTDDLVLPAVQEEFVRRRCDTGQSLEYRTYEGSDHVALVAADSRLTADLMQWTRDRLNRVPARPGCETIRR